MSEFFICQSQINDVECLKDALCDLGVPESAIVVYETPVELLGHRRKILADIVVSKGAISTSHDIGFKKNQNGTYDIAVYDGDMFSGRFGARVSSTKNGGTGELMQHYAKHRVLKHAKKKHQNKAKTWEKDGRIRIKVRVS